MGYETPNVAKTIIIPLQETDSGSTLEEYKNKYGIDLEEVFGISINESVVHIFKRQNCIYFVSFDGVIYPLFLCAAIDGSISIIGCDPYFDFSTEKIMLSAFFRINADKTITYIEL